MMAAKKVSKKIVVLGDPAVGKTSLIRRFVINAFDDKYLTTIGAKIVKKEVQLRSGGAKPDIDVTLMIWDVAGQKTLGNVKQAYYRGSEGAIIVCDITRRETLLSTIDWIKFLLGLIEKILSDSSIFSVFFPSILITWSFIFYFFPSFFSVVILFSVGRGFFC